MTDDWMEKSLKANATRDIIYQEFAEVLRNLVRAISINSDPTVPTGRAAEGMRRVIELIKRCEEEIRIFDMFAAGIDELRTIERPTGIDAIIRGVAFSGMSMLAEASCKDSAEKGRTSKKTMAFLQDIEALNRERGWISPLDFNRPRGDSRRFKKR